MPLLFVDHRQNVSVSSCNGNHQCNVLSVVLHSTQLHVILVLSAGMCSDVFLFIPMIVVANATEKSMYEFRVVFLLIRTAWGQNAQRYFDTQHGLNCIIDYNKNLAFYNLKFKHTQLHIEHKTLLRCCLVRNIKRIAHWRKVYLTKIQH